MKTFAYTWDNIHSLIIEIARSMQKQQWKPDYIIGISPNGLVPAVLLSKYLEVPIHPMQIRKNQFIDNNEEVFKHIAESQDKLLIISEFNDSGVTLMNIQMTCEEMCASQKQKDLFYENVKYASLIDNEMGDFQLDYCGKIISNDDIGLTVEFPWEQFWIIK